MAMIAPAFASAAGPELTATVTHAPSGDIKTGEPVTFDISIQNTGDAPTDASDALSAQATYPIGLRNVSVTTDDDAFWTSTEIGTPGCIALAVGDEGQMICGASQSLAVGETAPTIHFAGTVAPDAPDTITYEIDVSGGGAPSTSGTDSFTVVPAPILYLKKSHAGLFRLGDQATYDLSLANSGPKDTSGTITIADTLPTGLTYNSTSSDGNYWSCSNTGQDVSCTSSAVIAAGDSVPTLHLTVDVDPAAPGTVTNHATATGSADAVSGESSDVTPIYSATAEQIRLSIDPTEVATQTGNTGSFFRLRNLSNDTNVFLDFTQLVDKPVLTGAFEPDNGNAVTIDPSGVNFPAYTIHGLDTGLEIFGSKVIADAVVHFSPTDAWTGTYDPTTGDATLTMKVQIKLDIELTSPITGLVVGNCETGETNVDPLTTGHQNPPDPDVVPTPVTDGTPFGADSNGALINNDVEVSGVTCPYVNPLVLALAPDLDLPAAVNGLLGTPAPTGATDMRLEMHAAFPETNPALTIKVAPEGKIVLGTGGTYDLTVDNNSPVATDGSTVTVKDTLPAGLTYQGVDGTDAGWNCSAAGQDVTCTNDSTVAANGSLPPIKLKVGTDGNTAYPSVVNFATVEGGGSEGVSTGSHLTTISAPAYALSYSFDYGTYVVGSTKVFKPNVKNTGDVPTSGTVTLSGHLPRGITYDRAFGANWTCTAGAASATGQVVTCTSTTAIDAGSTDGPQLYLNALPVAVYAGTAHTSWTVSGGGAKDSVGPIDSAELPVAQAELDVTSTHTGDFSVGGQGEYTMVVTNTGFGASSALEPITVTDNLPDGLRFVSAGTDWQCSVSGQTVRCLYKTTADVNNTIAAGGSSLPLVITVAVDDDAYPSVTNAVTASGGMASNVANASDPTNVTATPVLAIHKGHVGDQRGEFQAGEDGAFTLDVDNPSPVDSDGTTVTVSDSLPAGLTYESASSEGDYWTCANADQDVTCTSDAVIAADSSAPTLTINTEVGDAAVPGVTNTGAVTGGGFADTAESSDSVVVNPAPPPPPITDKPILSIDASHQGDFNEGVTGDYKIAVSNVGKVDSEGEVTVTDALPIGLTYKSASGSGWTCAATGQKVNCTSSAVIASGGDAPAIGLKVDVGADAVPGVTNSASVQGGGAVSQAMSTDPTRVIAKPVPPPPLEAKITKVTVKPGHKKVKAGKAVKLTVKVKNGGDATATGVKICAKGPKRKVKLPNCKNRSIAAGATSSMKLNIKTKRKAKGKAKITVRVTSSNAGGKSASSNLTIKKAKRKR